MDRGTWQATTVHGVAKSWTQLSDFTSLCFTTESNNSVINCTSVKNNNKKTKTNKLSQLTRIFELVSGHESAISPDCQLF